MKKSLKILPVILISGMILIPCHPLKKQTLQGPYLGQEPPGMSPRIFAPGVISTDDQEGCSWFSKDNDFFLFNRRNSGILLMQQVNGIWSEPRPVSFHVDGCDGDFLLSRESRVLFLASLRPDEAGQEKLKYCRIWKIVRDDHRWLEPVLLPSPVNSGQHDSYPSVSNRGTLFFFSNRGGGYGKGDIYKSELIDGEYKQVENLGKRINTINMEGDPFIDPDERYLIFCSYKDGGHGGCDIYLSFNHSGKWTQPVNLGGRINSDKDEWMPYITPDGKYLFYTSDAGGNRDIYWVSSQIVTQLIPAMVIEEWKSKLH